ncbi:DUF1349 domain-containing protein [Chloroflexia bacterium SDU3-3]|nr:DUF1349 domain-containing protein [Chloroflexia bacterium SDU3-3]
MEWYNEPAKWTIHDSALHITAEPKTDFWRTTHYGFIRDSGHFGFNMAQGDFRCRVGIRGSYQYQYDQAGLMVRQDPHHWIKCGIEYVDGVQQASAVVTHTFSDWSVVPLAGHPPTVWFQIQRRGDAIEMSYTVDKARWVMLRLAYMPAQVPLQVGVMCASPQGKGFTTSFSDFFVDGLG